MIKRILSLSFILVIALQLKAQSPLDSFASAFKFRSIGPAFMSGRVADIAVHPDHEHTWYVAIGSGGVWKTENAGTTWKAVFEQQKVYSIGCLTIDPNNPHRVWVGTGENVGGRHVGYGDGIYLSEDDGQSWKNMGLPKSEHISKIIVHPSNSKVVWVAVQGPLWTSGGERGLYKTIDGGKTWNRTLEINEWTGVTDLVVDPRNPDMLYAASWQRHRTVAALMGGGPGSGLWKSEDGGDTWSKINKGLPSANMGKIGLAISPMQPDILYAAIELERRTGAVYRSDNRGASWSQMSKAVSGGTGPHYYQELYASPYQFDKIYLADWRMQVSEDGGKTFRLMNEQSKHSDNHAVAWKKNDPNYILVGSDGGLYESFDGEKNWKFHDNLPTIQYYKVAVDDAEPFYNIYGGTQDNNTHGGPSRTDNEHGIRNADWFITLGGDGHQPATEPGNPNILYCESQQGHLARVDRGNGESINIQPQASKGEPYERFNWDAPILVSAHKSTRIYFASQRLWKSENRGDSWTAVSGDLTKNEQRIEKEIMGAKQSWDNPWDIYAMSNFSTITSIAESPKNEKLLYVGTDDGLIQCTENGGAQWQKIKVGDLPNCPPNAFVNDLKADLHNEDVVYIVLDNHKEGDFRPFLYKSTNKGKSWTSIKGNLPEDLIVWRIVQDHINPKLLFLATESGVYTSVNGGAYWTKLKGGMPNIPVRDLAIQKRENDLIAATFGRGFYVLDDYTPLRSMADSIWNKDFHIFSSRSALWYVKKQVLGGGAASSQGASYYVADNPAFGANFMIYAKEDLVDNEKIRKEAEKTDKKAGKAYDFPGWDVLEEEARSLKNQRYATISDASGTVVRTIDLPSGKGLHVINWDLFTQGNASLSKDGHRHRRGFLCCPGIYRVTAYQKVDGIVEKIGQTQTIEVERLYESSIPSSSISDVCAFWREIEQTSHGITAMRMVLGNTGAQLKLLGEVIEATPKAPMELTKEWYDINQTYQKLELSVNGYKVKGEVGEKNDPDLSSWMSTVYGGVWRSTYGPNDLLRTNLKLAQEELGRIETELDLLVNTSIKNLEDKLIEAGAPYWEGREYAPR
jgi:photosystem II stability/assembly factor-like uncharacterized protein